jgi:hypothetical protein
MDLARGCVSNCDTSCDTVSQGRNVYTLELGLSQNAQPLSNVTDTIFTFTGVPAPTSGFFRGEIGVEAWYATFLNANIAAHYTSSADGRLGSDNFMSAQVAAGSGHIHSYGSTMPHKNNSIVLVYMPAATCRSTLTIPCRLVVTVPEGFTILSADAFNRSNSSNFSRFGNLLLRHVPSCNVKARTCTLDMAEDFALWANIRYAMSVSVINPPGPMAKNSPLNVWTVQLSGSYLWGFGEREYAQVATLSPSGHFAVLGHLRAAAVLPGSLICAASTYFRFQFITSQAVPVGGSVTFQVPAGFNFDCADGSSCNVQAGENWPSGVTYEFLDSQVVLSLSGMLNANAFYAFDIKGSWPASDDLSSDTHFKISTSIPETQLDVVERVTWSPQAHFNGELVFPQLFDCHSRGVDLFTLSLDDRRPYAVTLKATLAEVFFRWDAFDVDDSPLDVRVYAPPSYQWEISHDGDGFNATLSGGMQSPMMLFPGSSHELPRMDANVLRLMTTEPLQRSVLYGFSANIRLPLATPGTTENTAGGDAWYAFFGFGTRLAATRVKVVKTEIRAVQAFEILCATSVPLETGTLTAVFTTMTDLPMGGKLELLMPEGFDFAVHLGRSCVTDSLIASSATPSANLLPADLKLSCETLSAVTGASTVAVLQGIVGEGGLIAGRYVVSVYVKNPPPSEEDRSPGNFELRTFLNSGQEIGDMSAIFPAPLPTQRLPQAELVTAYLDSSAKLFDAHPSASTWVVFAFELKQAVSPNFVIEIQGPSGFKFQSACQVHIGDGSTYSPLGSSLKIPPPHAPQYALFPSDTNATCSMDGQEERGRIRVSPYGEGWSSFPALAGSLYLFRLWVTNPAATPSINEWHMKVEDQESQEIPGYDLWEFLTPSITPSNTATGEHNKVTIRFHNMQAMPGLSRGSDHGVLLIQMPSGYQLQTDTSSSLGCLDFQGLFNVTIAGSILMPNVCVRAAQHRGTSSICAIRVKTHCRLESTNSHAAF